MPGRFDKVLGLNRLPRSALFRLRPSLHSFLIVVGCFLIALLHLLCQSMRLSAPPPFISVSRHDPILPHPNFRYEPSFLTKEAQMYYSLPLDSISIKELANLQIFDSEDNVPLLTHASEPELTQNRAVDVTTDEKWPADYKEFEATSVKEVMVSIKRANQLAIHNAGAEQLSALMAESPYVGSHMHDSQLGSKMEVTIAPISKDQLTACERLVHMNPNADSHRVFKWESEADTQTTATNHQNVETHSSANKRPLINAEQIKKTVLQELVGKSQGSNQNRRRNRKVQKKKTTTKKSGHTSPSDNRLDAQGSKTTDFKDHVDHDRPVIKLEQNEPHPDEHASLQPKMNSTAKERLDWLKDNWEKISILYTDDHARDFPSRIDKFFTNNDTGTDACELRFFMTWIAPLRAFGSREKLALESVFKTHPSACLVILSRTLDTPKGHLILDPLFDKGFKVLAITPHIPFLLQSTPAEKWLSDLKEGLIDPGTISIYQNLSNLLRLVVLYKYGGVYIDNDIIVMKSFANFSNVIGAQNVDRETGQWSRLNNAVLVFDKKSPLLLNFIEEFYLTFNGSKWGHNGPYLVSRVVMKSQNLGCKVLDPSAFYPVDWDHIGGFFRAPRNSVEKQWVEAKMMQLNQHSFSIHLWNKLSRSIDVEPGSIMDSIFRRFCILCDMLTNDTMLKADA